MAKKKVPDSELTQEEQEMKLPDVIVRIGAGYPLHGPKRAPYGWSSSDAGIASVNKKGEVSGIAVGEATISCDFEGEGASWLVKVIPAPLLGSW